MQTFFLLTLIVTSKADPTCRDVKGFYKDSHCCKLGGTHTVQGCSPVTTTELAKYQKVYDEGSASARIKTFSEAATHMESPPGGDINICMCCSHTDNTMVWYQTIMAKYLEQNPGMTAEHD